MISRKKENRFNAAVKAALALHKEASDIVEEYFAAGAISALITVENANALAGNHEWMMNMYRCAAQQEFTCECCQEKARRGEITLHLKDKQPTLTS